MSLSARALQAIKSANCRSAFLFLIKITASTLPAPLYFTNSLQAVTSNSIVYLPLNFRLSLPAQSKPELATTNLVIDNTDLYGSYLLRTLPTKSRSAVEVSVVMADYPDDIEFGPLYLKYKAGSADLGVANLSLGHEDLANEMWPTHKFGPNSHPGQYGTNVANA